MDILERLRAKVGFTDTEGKIADYVLGHSRQISGMSAETLAKATFSSKASIIRMCRKIGLSGYREFQIVLTARERLTARRDGVPASVTRDFADVIRAAADNCAERVSEKDLRRAAGWIAYARRAYVYASDLSTAVSVCHMLSSLGVAAAVPGLFDAIPPGNLSEDVALFLSHSADGLRGLRPIMDALRSRDCRVILIAPDGVPADADIFIPLPCGENITYTQTAFLYVMACMRRMVGDEIGQAR